MKVFEKKTITPEMLFPASGCDWFTRHPRFLRRVILKTHHILRVVASPKKWLVFVGISNLANPWLIFGISKNCDGFFKKPITICSAQPKKFGDQSPYPPASQKNLATNHPIHPLAKTIWSLSYPTIDNKLDNQSPYPSPRQEATIPLTNQK